MTAGIKRTREEIKKIIEDKDLIFIDTFTKNWTTYIDFQDTYGYRYLGRLSTFTKGIFPNSVGVTNPYSLQNINLWCKNNKKSFFLSEDNVYSGNNKYLNFYCCKCDENFISCWSNIFSGFGCGKCSGSQVGIKNSFLYCHPELVLEWSDKNKKSPSDFTSCSNQEILWKCKKCNYEWNAPISRRTSNGHGCPACSGRATIDSNRLLLLYPIIAKSFHPTKNKIRVDELSFASNKKVWWLCDICGNEWETKVIYRTSDNCGCPVCASKQTESKIAFNLKKYFVEFYNAIPEYKILKNQKTKLFLPFDIYLPNEKVFIEIHGEQHYEFKKFWHKTQEHFKYCQSLDKLKKEFAENNGLYIELDIRKNKPIDKWITYIENTLKSEVNLD